MWIAYIEVTSNWNRIIYVRLHGTSYLSWIWKRKLKRNQNAKRLRNNIPAILMNSCLVFRAWSSLGKIINCCRTRRIASVTDLQHLPTVDSDTFIESPTSLWYAPVAKNLRHTNNCKSGGKALFFVLFINVPPIKSNKYTIDAWWNLYLSKSSSSV